MRWALGLPYFIFFCSYRASKAGVPPGHATRDGGVSPGTSSEDAGGVLSGEGTQPEMAAPGGLRGRAPHPILTHLQMLCGAPRCQWVVIAQLQWGSSSTVCSKIANSLF